MGLLMKPQCERCNARIDPEAEACICSYECTFCPACAEHLGQICPNCGGELVPRPRRQTASVR